MATVLGVEGGGSHTHAVVVETSGALMGLGANDDPANWEDVGIEAAGAAIRSCVREALDRAGVKAEAVDASIFTLAGMDFPMDEQRLGGIPPALGLGGRCRMVNDAFGALRAGTDEPFGVVVVGGTGSVVAGRNPDGEEYRTLGLGPILGDPGSATEVSEMAMTAVAYAFTGRGPQTALSELLCAAAGVGSVVELLEGAGRGRIDLSGFAPQVVRAAEEGDGAAESILTRAGEMLGATAAHVIRQLHMGDVAFDLVLDGRMFRSTNAALVRSLEECVRPVASGVKLNRLWEPPVVGAALLAFELVHEPTPRDIRTGLTRAVASSLGSLRREW
jgi:N-acetylglucosamine kinase-like BadF-type ATPase